MSVFLLVQNLSESIFVGNCYIIHIVLATNMVFSCLNIMGTQGGAGGICHKPTEIIVPIFNILNESIRRYIYMRLFNIHVDLI